MTRDEVCSRFLETVPYKLYAFQEEALLAWFSSEAGVLVCAPTGMGKTLIAEAAVFEALHTGQRLYYTTPLIALTDQKFRDFQELAERWGFPREEVGLITGNRRVNPEARIRVVVAEILLNHLIAPDAQLADIANVQAVVMDEFHNFNDPERGIVWELSLVLLPRHVRVLLLSATVGNPYDFAYWLEKKHGRKLEVVVTQERRVPLEYHWVDDRLLTEHLVQMVQGDEEERRTPALVFAFNRDSCWELAEKLKGLSLVSEREKRKIEEYLSQRKEDLAEGAGPKLRQMLLRGVGVHHAGVLPKHKEIVEELFEQKLVPFVCCTETLSAGINLPARSVVLSTLLKGPHGEMKLIPASSAHQMFGRAGRPQYDKRGYVYAVAHDDDVKINKWRKKYEQIPATTKDPGLLRARKELERKRPTRRATEQYWSEGQFRTLIAAGPAKLASRSMIPYQVLIYLLTRTGTLKEVREFLSRRFASPERIEKFNKQLDCMLDNLQALGYLRRSEDGEHIELDASVARLRHFRSVDPLYGAFAAEIMNYSNFEEKVEVLESVLPLPPPILRKVPIPEDLPKGPLQEKVLEPQLVAMGLIVAEPQEEERLRRPRRYRDPWEEEEEAPRRLTLPEMLPPIFQARLAAPEPVVVQPKWVAGETFRLDCEFFKFVRRADLIKQEGIILRHLLRLVILAGEFYALTEDPDYLRIAELSTRCCRRVDERYTDRFLAEAEAMRKALGG
jgi:superfamily II DNA/RNA helicase